MERTGRVTHGEAMRHMQRARALLLLVNDTPNLMGILPGKLFEYLSTGRPILAVGPQQGDVARVLHAAPHLVIDRQHLMAEQARILPLFNAPTSMAADRYARRATCAQVVEVLEG
jgi:hypothetical protein